MQKHVYLHAIRTLVPSHAMSQDSIREFMKTRLDQGLASGNFIDRIYDHSGIACRHTVLDDLGTLVDTEPGTAQRNLIYTRLAAPAAVAVSRGLFGPARAEGSLVEAPRPADAGTPGGTGPEGGGDWKQGPSMGMSPVHADAVTHVITVSCTGFSAPGFDIAVQKELRLGPGIKRSHIGFMGCCAAFPALRNARDICLADPAAVVMVVMVEFCTLHFSSAADRDTLVANSLFSDGAAAFLVSSGRPSTDAWELDAFSTTLVEDSGNHMAWTIGDKGFTMRLSAYVPRIVGANIQEVLSRIQAGLAGASRSGAGAHAIHPGGRAILEKVESSLGLEVCLGCNDQSRDPGLESSWRILRDYGNMSAVTMAFVLADLGPRLDGAAGRSGKNGSSRVFAAGFGPGLTVEAGLFRFRSRRRMRGFRHRHGVESPGLPAFPSLVQRLNRLELMDDPGVDRESLDRTFRQFGLLNRLFSGYRRILDRDVLGLMSRLERESGAPRTWRILDVGCGGGDILAWLAREAERRGLDLDLVGLDPDPEALAMAGPACAAWPRIRLVRGGFRDWPRTEKADFVISNHMLHHLDHKDAMDFIAFAAEISNNGPVLVDIRRSRLAYWSYGILSRLVSPGALAPYDGSLSVLRSFSHDELESLAFRAGIGEKARVERRWPFRLVLKVSQEA